VLLLCVLDFSFGYRQPYKFPPRWVPVPSKGWEWGPCVHEVQSGTLIEEDTVLGGLIITEPNKLPLTIPKCVRPERHVKPFQVPHSTNVEVAGMNGWQAWTAFNNANNATFDAFLGYFDTPSAPSNFPLTGILYTFTGLQNDNWVPDFTPTNAPPTFNIIQPVLQYGAGSENGGGLYWGLASWYVTVDAGALYSETIKIQPGTNIFGNMTRTGSRSWFIAGVTPNGQSTNITVTHSRLAQQPWAYNTLEVYNLPNCNNLPSKSVQNYTKLQLFAGGKQVPASWTTLNSKTNMCNTKMRVNTANNVTLFFS